jgi:site-specific DNA-methyltransferase (adenine-specific)
MLKVASLKYCNNAAGIPTQSIAKGGKPRWANSVKGYPARNKRDVWLIPTRPFKEAHFATFPPELVSHWALLIKYM